MVFALPFLIVPGALFISALPMAAAGATSGLMRQFPVLRVTSAATAPLMAAAGGLVERTIERAANTGASELITMLQIGCMAVVAFFAAWIPGPPN